MRIAGIDLGTNTLLLLVADIREDGTIIPVHNEQRIPRLGRDVDGMRRIHPSAFDRIAWILNEFKNLSVQLRCDRITACATSAVRDAVNRDDFLKHLGSTTGIEVEVLSGEEEALWSYRGAMSGLQTVTRPVVIDIGGGSTEVSFPSLDPPETERDRLRHFSFQLGSVRLTERYLHHNPPFEDELQAARKEITSLWIAIPGLTGGNFNLVGVAGTVTTLSCLDQGLSEFDMARVSGYPLSREHVQGWLHRLSGMRKEEIEGLSKAAEGRADILPAGLLILDEFMKRYRFDTVLTSERGLRYGLVLRESEKMRNVR